MIVTLFRPAASAIRIRRLRPIIAALCWLLCAAVVLAAPALAADGPRGIGAPESAGRAQDTPRGDDRQSPDSSVALPAPSPVSASVAAPGLLIRTEGFDVGTVPFGMCIRDSFAVENISADTITLLPVTLTDPVGEITLIEGVPPGGRVAPSGFIWIVFEYCARRYGCDMAWITATTAGGELDSVSIYGCTAEPTTTLGYDTLDFGAVGVGRTTRRTYTIPPMPGSPAYGIHAVEWTRPNGFALVTSVPETTIRVPAGEQGKLDFTFTPSTSFGAQGLFRVLVDGGWRELVVRGYGVSYPIAVDPYPLQFGQVAVGEQRVLKLDVSNLAGVGVMINNVRIVPGPFDLALGEQRTFFLETDERRPIFIQFAPTSPGEVRRMGYLLGATDADTLAAFELVGNGLDTTKPIPEVDRHVWLDSTVANAGEVASLFLRVAPPLTPADTIHWLTAEIAFPERACQVIEALPGRDARDASVTLRRLQPGRIEVELKGARDSVIGGELVELRVRGLSTGRFENDIPLTRIELSRPIGVITPTAGRLWLLGCSVGTIDAVARRVSIRSIAASADAAAAIVRYTSPAGAAGDARIVDLQGRQVSRMALPPGTGEESEARISLEGVSPGFYLVQLRVADDAVAAPMMVAP